MLQGYCASLLSKVPCVMLLFDTFANSETLLAGRDGTQGSQAQTWGGHFYVCHTTIRHPQLFNHKFSLENLVG